MDLESRRLARTARTYPVGRAELARAVEKAVRELPRWELETSSEDGVRAVRRTRLGCAADVGIQLTPLHSGAHTNTHASFESASRKSPWNFGRNKRNLVELLQAIDGNLMPET